MQRKVSKEKFYYAGKSKTSQDLVHQHMSNHYRKILNAKKAIDDGPPQSYKAKRPATSNPGAVKNKVNRQLDSPALTDRSISTNSNKGSCWGTESYAGSSRYHARCIPETPTFGNSTKNAVDMDLVNRITYDTKKGPASYCGEGWTDAKSQNNDKNYKATLNAKTGPSQRSTSPTVKRRLPHTSSQESPIKRKFAAQQETDSTSNVRINSPLDVSPYKCSKIAVDDSNDAVLKKITFNPKEQSLTSSRDSAYNGGVSSLPESRSPTPDERKKKECCCCCCEKKNRDVKFLKSVKTDSKAVESNIEPSKSPEKVLRPSIPKPKSQEQDDTLNKIKEDELYVKFIQDITTEVLEKNLYTNKALKNVMKKHIKNNLFNLNKDRMLKEVEYLRAQLGIPEDESLQQLEGCTEESETDAAKSYPLISDSEFVMPKKNLEDTNVENKTSKKMPRSVSPGTKEDNAVFGSGSDNDRQVLSVIQVTKAIRKEKTPVMISRENSFDDSDRPFDSKSLSILKNLKKKIPRSDSSSSSSDSETFIRKNWDTKKEESSENDEFEVSSKKTRNVSFWHNPELSVTRTGRTIEVKKKKTIIRGNDSGLLDKREKTKND